MRLQCAQLLQILAACRVKGVGELGAGVRGGSVELSGELMEEGIRSQLEAVEEDRKNRELRYTAFSHLYSKTWYTTYLPIVQNCCIESYFFW